MAAGASAQSHEMEHGRMALCSSTVASDRISPATAKLRGIDQSPDRAILNVVLPTTQTGTPANLPAQVSASTLNMAGVRQVIEMREVRANEQVSCMGSYAFAPRECLDFEVKAQPMSAISQKPLTLRYQGRMWAR
jgi:hypothetical protein